MFHSPLVLDRKSFPLLSDSIRKGILRRCESLMLKCKDHQHDSLTFKFNTTKFVPCPQYLKRVHVRYIMTWFEQGTIFPKSKIWTSHQFMSWCPTYWLKIVCFMKLTHLETRWRSLEWKKCLGVVGHQDKMGRLPASLWLSTLQKPTNCGNQLVEQCIQLGFRPIHNCLLHDFESQEQELEHLGGHSEKIALCWAIQNNPPHVPIVIRKNLRTCPDCHEAMKWLSIVLKRKISLSDASCWHHNENGKCSCGDYFWNCQ